MRIIRLIFALMLLVFCNGVFAATASQLSQALVMVRSGQYQQAIPILYSFSHKSEFAKEKMQIKYILGSALLELKLYQVAAFQFVDVIRDGKSKYVRQAIEKLSLAADALGDDTLLNYVVSRIKEDSIPETGRDLITYRLAEHRMKKGQFAEAISLLSKIGPDSRYAFEARYKKGLALDELKRPKEAISVFQALLNSRSQAPVTDTNRVIAQLALARTYYQAQDWDNAIQAYREIPRDHELWHESLFELTWALLRGAQFRSALSNFQSLHSAYYEDFYLPESLLVRGIVYLYICKYDEMDKVLGLFEKTYGSVRAQMGEFLQQNRDPITYFNEVDAAANYRSGKNMSSKMKLPRKVAFRVLEEGDVKRAFSYIRALNGEKNRLDGMVNLANSAFGNYARKVLINRYRNAKIGIGERVKAHLIALRLELRDLYEQAGFLKYEMINGRKEQLKKKIAGKTLPTSPIDEKVDRTFYVQNGYEYWPFRGEFWLDEIGNYHYLGKQSCE